MSGLPQPGSGGEFPVTPALLVALGAGFAFFNEVLFWTLGMALAHDERVAQAALFMRVSGWLGAAIWTTFALAMACAASRRWTDAAAAAVTLTALIGVVVSTARPAGWIVGVNIALGLWLARGWGKRKFARNNSVTI
jgi:hypothetical protein